MRTLLVFIATFGLPLVALAQPATDDGKSTEVSDLVVTAKRATALSELVVTAKKATALSDLTVEGLCAVPPETRWPDKFFDPPSDLKNDGNVERPGTREFILRDIAALRNNTRDYEHLTFLMASTARHQLLFTRRQVICRGVFKDIKFLHVTKTGDDDFEVDFSNEPLEWEVKPPNSKQLISQFAIRFFYPQPATQLFEDLLKSMEQDQPNYADLTPDFAATLQAQWPTLRQTLKNWKSMEQDRLQAQWPTQRLVFKNEPGSHPIYFLRKEDDGSYTYKVVYKDHPVIWKVAPLDEAGKITGLKYDDGSN